MLKYLHKHFTLYLAKRQPFRKCQAKYFLIYMKKDSLIEYTKAELIDIERSFPICAHNAGHYEISLREWSTQRINGRADYQLIYLVRGHMRVTLNGKTEVIESGSVLIYKPGQTQIYTYMNDVPCEVYWVHFYGTLIPQTLKELLLDDIVCTNIGINYQIPQLINAILVDLINEKFGAFYANGGRLMLILSEVALCLKKNSDAEINNERFNTILLQMHDISSNLSIKDLAATNNLSVSRFSHLFTQTFGISPHSYRMKIKIDRAKYLLSENDYSVKEIAEMLGFDDQFYFSRLFKKHSGVSPQAFRNIQKQK